MRELGLQTYANLQHQCILLYLMNVFIHGTLPDSMDANYLGTVRWGMTADFAFRAPSLNKPQGAPAISMHACNGQLIVH